MDFVVAFVRLLMLVALVSALRWAWVRVRRAGSPPAIGVDRTPTVRRRR
jgi:hypothetical protein